MTEVSWRIVLAMKVALSMRSVIYSVSMQFILCLFASFSYKGIRFGIVRCEVCPSLSLVTSFKFSLLRNFLKCLATRTEGDQSMSQVLGSTVFSPHFSVALSESPDLFEPLKRSSLAFKTPLHSKFLDLWCFQSPTPWFPLWHCAWLIRPKLSGLKSYAVLDIHSFLSCCIMSS